MTRWGKAVADLGLYPLPAPPPGGGYIVLSPAQISDWDLVCLFRLAYPDTKLIAQQPLDEAYGRGGVSLEQLKWGSPL